MTQTNREYAEALFELALGEGNVAEVAAALDLVEREMGENPGYLAMLASPAISRENRMKALDEAFGDRVPRTVTALMKMMVSRGHAREIGEMIIHWRELLRDHRGESTARVISAVPLTEGQQQVLQQKLEKMFSRKMVLLCQVDPTLLGGIRVETEGRVLDGTLLSRLHQIKEVMDS